MVNYKKSIKKNRRGKSGKEKYFKNRKINLSIMGCNANGINGKIASLQNAIKYFGSPSCLTIQESKLQRNNFKLPGYQVYQ